MKLAMLAATIALAALGAGCINSCPMCCRGSLAHPTMAPEDIALGIDARVRAVSEGATSRP